MFINLENIVPLMASPKESRKKEVRLLRTRKKERTRNTIITEAMRLFSEKSYEEVKLEEIAESAFISRKTLYNYFKNKEDVFFAVGNKVYKEENEKMGEIINSDLTGKDQVLLLCEKKFRDNLKNPILLKIIREFWDRFTLRNVSSEEEYNRISETIGATKLTELVEKSNFLNEFEFESYFEESNYNELFVQFLKNGNCWVKAIQKGKQDNSIKVDLTDMQIMQYINILTDGTIHEKNRRQSALDRINLKSETIESETKNLVSFFLAGLN
jgi:AcrR family transcriptional regulator